MNAIQQTLPLPSRPLPTLDASRARARVGRFLKLLLAAVAVPLGVAVAAPLVGLLFAAFVLLSPLLLVFALANAHLQGEEERQAYPDGLAQAVAPIRLR